MNSKVPTHSLFLSLLIWLLVAPAAVLAAVPAEVPSEKKQTPDGSQVFTLTENEARVRVRLLEDPAAIVKFRGMDLRIFEATSEFDRGHTTHKLAASPSNTTEWDFKCEAHKITAKGSNGQSLVLSSPVMLKSMSGFVSLNGKKFRDLFHLHSRGKACAVVNELNIEAYIAGLLNTEFSAKWSPESVAAQAIASRTYALYQIKKAQQRVKSYYDVDSDIRDQVYGGPETVDSLAAKIASRTRGLVLALSNSEQPQPIKAYYHQTCGGMTQLPQKVWGHTQEGFQKRVTCEWCKSSPRYEWQLKLKTSDLSRAFQTGAEKEGAPSSWGKDWKKLLESGELKEIALRRPDRSGRVALVETIWEKEGQRHKLAVASTVFRKWLGTTSLRSTAFGVDVKKSAFGDDEWTFEGRGSGHGVGMCQWGAKGMGEKGYRFQEILARYYPGATLRKLW